VRDDILARLSERVRYYSLAQHVGDSWLETQNRSELGWLLERLLSNHLHSASTWDRHAFVDLVIPLTLELSEDGIAVLSGVAMWRGQAGAFLDPLDATFELSSDSISVRGYSLRFGDAERGLGAMKYERTVAPIPARPPLMWCFEFREVR
jgi:hypothetical protein